MSNIPYMEMRLNADSRDVLNRLLQPQRRYYRNHIIPNLLDNGDFEDEDTPTDIPGWSMLQAGPNIVAHEIGPGKAHSGDDYIRLYAETPSWCHIRSTGGVNDTWPMLYGQKHQLSFWYNWQANDEGTEFSVIVFRWLIGSDLFGPADHEIATVIPLLGAAGWHRYVLTYDNTDNAAFRVKLRLSQTGGSPSEIWLDDAIMYPMYDTFDLTYLDFERITPAFRHRYDFPYCHNLQTKTLDEPVMRTRSGLGYVFQQPMRRPIPAWRLDWPTMSMLYVRLLYHYYLASRGQEITFYDWMEPQNAYEVFWRGPWVAQTDIDLVAPMRIDLEQSYPETRSENVFG